MVAAVATLEPDTAANTAQPAVAACASPPGSGRSTLAMIENSSLVIPLRTSTTAISTLSGTAVNEKLLTPAQARSARVSGNGTGVMK